MGFLASILGTFATPLALVLCGISLGIGVLVRHYQPTLSFRWGALPAFWAGLAVGCFLLLVLGLSSCAVSCAHLPPTSCS